MGIRNNSSADFYLLQLQGTNNIEARFRNSTSGGGTTGVYTIAKPITPQSWQHLALVYDGTKLRYYVNAVCLDSVAASGSIALANVDLTMGRTFFTTPFYMKGKLDEATLWNTALTKSEIKCLMNAPANITSPGLKLYYNMNHGVRNGNNSTVTTLVDQMGNIDATLNGLTLNGTTSNFVEGAPNTQYQYQSICSGQSTTFNGQTLNQSGFYTQTLAGSQGCDSVTVLELNVTTINNNSITQISSVLHCNQDSASYQWVDCSNSTPIAGATSQDFTPSSNGSYQCIITINGCSDAAPCVNYLFNGVNELNNLDQISIYPNPAANELNIQKPANSDRITCVVTSLDGKEVLTLNTNESNTKVDVTSLAKGIYFMNIKAGQQSAKRKIVIQ